MYKKLNVAELLKQLKFHTAHSNEVYIDSVADVITITSNTEKDKPKGTLTTQLPKSSGNPGGIKMKIKQLRKTAKGLEEVSLVHTEDEYIPVYSVGAFEKLTTSDVKVLKRWFRSILSFTMEVSDPRNYLRCIILQPEKKRAWASDGTRAFFIPLTTELIEILPSEGEFGLPTDALRGFLKALNSDCKKLSLERSSDGLIFHAQGTQVRLPYHRHKYPNMEQIVPRREEYKIIFRINRKEFIKDLKKLKKDNKKKDLEIIFRFWNHHVTLEVNDCWVKYHDPDVIDYRSINEIVNNQEETLFEAKFNLKYFLQCLENMISNRVQIAFHDRYGPCRIEGMSNTSDEVDEHQWGVVMPIMDLG